MLKPSTKSSLAEAGDGEAPPKSGTAASVADAVSLIDQWADASYGKTAAAMRIVLQKAVDGRAVALAAVKMAKTRVADLEKVPPESLPDSDEAIREHLVNVEVAKVRISRAEKTLADAEAAALAAREMFDDEFLALETAHEKGAAERAAFLREAPARLAQHCDGLIDVLIEAMALDAWAKALKSGGGRPAPLARDAAILRLELVDGGGRSLFKIDSAANFTGEA